MEWFRELGGRLLMLVRRKQFEDDLEDEMRLHRDLRKQEQISAGLSEMYAPGCWCFSAPSGSCC
ncbi:MAG TPA: hypothetical protein VI455_01870 [Terriglobia bacterium]